jgi:large subunit ribosomal protein L21
MYAVFQTGGKQYRVQAGDVVLVEKLAGDIGGALKFDQVLMLAKDAPENTQIWLGKPLVAGATVTAQIVDQGRGEKTFIIKMKRRKQYRRMQGHRQEHTQLLITAVDNGAGEKAGLSASETAEKVKSFQRWLTPKGQAFTPKTLGSRKRMKAAKAAAPKAGAKATKKAAK